MPGPLFRDTNASLNETDIMPHNLTKFSEMNNSIQVLKTADIMVGEHQMMDHSAVEHVMAGQVELKPTIDGDLVNEARNEMTSVMSSLNQSLLDNQPSNAISQSFVDLEQEEEEVTSYDNAYETK